MRPDDHNQTSGDDTQAALEALPHGVLLFHVAATPEGLRLSAANGAAREITGRPLKPRSPARAALGDFWELAAPLLEAAIAGADPHPRCGRGHEIRVRRQGGIVAATLTPLVAAPLCEALDALPVALVVEDPSARIAYFNAAFAAHVGTRLDNLRIGAKMTDLAREYAARGGAALEDGQSPESWARNFIAGQRRGETQRLVASNGDVSLCRAKSLATGGALGWSLNVTQAILEESANRWISRQRAFVARVARIGGWRFEISRGVFELDEGAKLIPGFEGRDYLTREEIRAMQQPGAVMETLQAFQRCLEHGERLDLERCVRLDGEERWIRLMAEREIRDGAVFGLVGVLQEITEQKQRELSLNSLSARFQAVLENVDSALFIKDRNGRYLNVAKKFLTKTSGSPRIGALDVDCLHPALGQSVRQADLTALRERRPVTQEYETDIDASGQRRILLATSTPFHDPILDDIALCVTGIDITEIKALQNELEISRDAAEAASLAKSQFLATISHEIRTPLNGVTGMAQLLERTLKSPEQLGMIRILKESAQQLLGLFDDILDWSHIETGKIALEPQPMRIGEVFDRLRVMHSGRLREKGLTLSVELDEGARGEIEADPKRIGQLLHQLLSNAVKFTDHGEITLAARLCDDAALELSVRDTGMGMTAGQAERIYDRFTQADMGDTRRHGGAGLGMSIVKGLVDAMGGAVSLKTAPQQGAHFTVTIPHCAPRRTPGLNEISAD